MKEANENDTGDKSAFETEDPSKHWQAQHQRTETCTAAQAERLADATMRRGQRGTCTPERHMPLTALWRPLPQAARRAAAEGGRWKWSGNQGGRLGGQQ
jgi:hypothetical protein